MLTVYQDAESSTASVSNSIFDYRRENGRTYHAYKDGSRLSLLYYPEFSNLIILEYALPNDEREKERLGMA